MSIFRKLFGGASQKSQAAPPIPPPPAPPSASNKASADPPKEIYSRLMSQVLYADKPIVDTDRFTQELAKYLPASRVVSASDSLIMISHADSPMPIPIEGQSLPAQTNILFMDEDKIGVPHLEHTLSQTWDWPEVRSVIQRTKRSVLITEFLMPPDDLRERLRLFHGVHRALLAVTSPIAVCPLAAERIVRPEEVNVPLPDTFDGNTLALFANVRMVTVLNTNPQQVILDTRGLAELGLPDLQIHCSGLPEGQVAGLLYSLAGYLLQNGDCINDGHTVQGLTPDQRWRCQHENALFGPPRVVLDIDPGAPFAAGERKPATT